MGGGVAVSGGAGGEVSAPARSGPVLRQSDDAAPTGNSVGAGGDGVGRSGNVYTRRRLAIGS